MSDPKKSGTKGLSRPQFDLLVAALVFSVGLALGGAFDVAEAWIAFAERYEAFELDEIPMALGLLALCLAWFAWRRWQDCKAETHERAKAKSRLEEELLLRKKVEAGLIKAHHEAEVAHRAKAEFLANISHELRTPLNAIIGFAELVENEVHGPIEAQEYKDYVAGIVGSGRHLLTVINDILDLAKIDAGELKLHEETVDLARAAKTAVRQVTPEGEDRGVSVRVDWAETPPSMLGDRKLVMQILVNLLSNAVKFSDAGDEVCLSIAIEPKGHCALRVIDQGIGMSEEDIAVALRPFGQVDSAFSRSAEGVGLGLSLAKALTGLHDGDLTIDSTPGEGTTVTVTLPKKRLLQTESPAVRIMAAG